MSSPNILHLNGLFNLISCCFYPMVDRSWCRPEALNFVILVIELIDPLSDFCYDVVYLFCGLADY